MGSGAWFASLGLIFLSAPAAAQDRFDVCALLSKAEIQEVQGAPLKETKSSAPARKGFAVLQCFYSVAPFDKSVSLVLTRRDPNAPSSKGPREEWHRLFHPDTNRANKSQTRGKEEQGGVRQQKKESGPPERVEGLGDEAFWAGNRFVGALYVLKGQAYFRISVGGWADEAVRLEKTKALAQKALKRL